MNKNWDKAVVGIETWKECLRVLKPGAFAFVMSAPRQDVLSRIIVNLENAGFAMSFTAMAWAYASGFPKAKNMSKAVDKKLGKEREIIEHKHRTTSSQSDTSHKYGFGEKTNGNYTVTKPSSPQAKKLDGSYAGFQPKPAIENILVCMKPLSEKNYTEQAMKNGKGVTWLDDCKIPYKNEKDFTKTKTGYRHGFDTENAHEGWQRECHKNYIKAKQDVSGRFPANLLVSDDVLNDGKITKSKRVMMKPDNGGTGNTYTIPHKNYEMRGHDDEGTFSRHFDLDAWAAQNLSQFIITPKASKSEKNKNLDSFIEKNVNDGRKTEIDNPFQRGDSLRKNTHPTVKPVSLFSYLITLGSREHDLILDPFSGSGTTAIACHMLARNYICIEKEKEYVDTAKMRVDEFLKQGMIEEFY